MSYSPMELAAVFIKTGELNDALDALNAQLDVKPNDQDARRLRAEVLARMPERWQDALNDLALLENPTPDDFTRQSVLRERLNDVPSAIATMDAALAAYPGNERLIERQVYLLQKQGDLKAALDVLARQPHTWRWLQWSGDLAAQNGDPAFAAQAYTDALALLEPHGEGLEAIRARLLLARAGVYRQLSQLDAADADYQAAAVLMPGDPAIPFNRGLIAGQRGHMEQAVSLCRDALQQASAMLREKMIMELHTHYPEIAAVLLSDG